MRALCDCCLKKKDIFCQVSYRIFFDYNLSAYLKIAEPYFYIKLTKDVGYFPQFQPVLLDNVSISEFLDFISVRFVDISESVSIIDSLVFYVDAQKNDTLSVSELIELSMQYFTASQDAVTITENLIFTTTNESGIINGSEINGAII